MKVQIMTINSVQKSSKSELSSGGKRPFKNSSKSTETSNKNDAIHKDTEAVKHRNCVEARLHNPLPNVAAATAAATVDKSAGVKAEATATACASIVSYLHIYYPQRTAFAHDSFLPPAGLHAQST